MRRPIMVIIVCDLRCGGQALVGAGQEVPAETAVRGEGAVDEDITEAARAVPRLGLAMGRAFFFDSEALNVPRRTITAEQVPAEITRFEEGLAKTRASVRAAFA